MAVVAYWVSSIRASFSSRPPVAYNSRMDTPIAGQRRLAPASTGGGQVRAAQLAAKSHSESSGRR